MFLGTVPTCPTINKKYRPVNTLDLEQNCKKHFDDIKIYPVVINKIERILRTATLVNKYSNRNIFQLLSINH